MIIACRSQNVVYIRCLFVVSSLLIVDNSYFLVADNIQILGGYREECTILWI